MTTTAQNYLFVEKYRPKKIADCILGSELKKTFTDVISSGEMQNFLFCGGAGSGKTTVARILCEQMHLDYLFINASESGNIDTLRTSIRNFASTVSLQGGKKVVILDEGDGITPTTQNALRGFYEEFSANCMFIITCNFRNRIIEPIQSRCSVIDFKIPSKEKQKLAAEMLGAIEKILKAEKITYDTKVLVELILKYFPDFRRTLGELQRYSVSGVIDVGILSKLSDLSISDLIGHMKAKNFTEVRKWVGANTDLDSATIFRKLYDSLSGFLEKASIPAVVLVLADYQYKMAFSSDHEICLSACLAEIMLNAEFLP